MLVCRIASERADGKGPGWATRIASKASRFQPVTVPLAASESSSRKFSRLISPPHLYRRRVWRAQAHRLLSVLRRKQAKKKPAFEGGLKSNSFLRRVGGDRKQYAASQHIG